MSHFTERKEKNCLNCNAVIYGRYCHLCGQENVVPKETFGHLVTHFIYDITHFDGKFFSSVKYLLFRPGFLSMEYIRGKRAAYLNPIKMYVFISAFFFLFFFTFITSAVKITETDTTAKTYKQVKAEIEKRIEALELAQKQKDMPGFAKQIIKDETGFLQQDLTTLKKDTSHLEMLNFYKVQNKNLLPGQYKDVRYYDSVQKSLPEDKRDGFFTQLFRKKKMQLDEKYGKEKNALQEKLLEKYSHSFPQMLFVSLPLFALILKLLYIRRKNFYYADHIIYAVHLYCATFIFMFFIFSFQKLYTLPHLHWLVYVMLLIFIYVLGYVYKSMRNFYKQGRAKTLLKFFITLLMSSVLMTFLFILFLIFSLFAI